MSYELSLAIHFEDFCEELLKSIGYDVEKNIIVENDDTSTEIDLLVTNKDKVKTIIEIKFYRTVKPNFSMLKKAFNQLERIQRITNYKNMVLMLALPIDDNLRKKVETDSDIKIIDGIDIYNKILNHHSLLEKFKLLMSSVTNNIFTSNRTQKDVFSMILGQNEPWKAEENIKYNINKYKYFFNELESIKPGNKEFAKYENACIDILKYLFDLNLGGWHEQKSSVDGLNRFDLVCRVKRGNEFWDLIIGEFNSRYVIFEFKNYKDPIKQGQIYTTEKYLYKTALRNVAFIISRKEVSLNALKTTRSILRENGKLIINICDQDLLNMVQLKDNGDEPSDYLFENVDTFLLELGK